MTISPIHYRIVTSNFNPRTNLVTMTQKFHNYKYWFLALYLVIFHSLNFRNNLGENIFSNKCKTRYTVKMGNFGIKIGENIFSNSGRSHCYAKINEIDTKIGENIILHRLKTGCNEKYNMFGAECRIFDPGGGETLIGMAYRSKQIMIRHNKMMKMINGNMKGINKLNFLQYNKGNSKYETKEVFLNRVIIENNIDVACICEANITDSYLTNNNILEGFNIETKPLAKNYDLSRNVILINDKIQ